MGTNAVGAMIVAGPEGFAKNQYRKFNIKTEGLTPGDDFGMMREVLTRRFKRLLKEHGLPAGEIAAGDGDFNPSPCPSPTQARLGEPATHKDAISTSGYGGRGDDVTKAAAYPLSHGERAGVRGVALAENSPAIEVLEDEEEAEALGGDVAAWPELLLIDGGAGQLSAAQEVLAALGLHGMAITGIAKGPDRNAGRERFFMPGKQPFSLPPNDPVLYFVQRLRDEAHRFAIGSHRAKRKKAMSETSLDDIPGIGPSRRRALLRHFGSAKSVSRAGLPDLRAVPGISAAMAQQIYNYFHSAA
jgi:excinuclease ABC subunit C